MANIYDNLCNTSSHDGNFGRILSKPPNSSPAGSDEKQMLIAHKGRRYMVSKD